MSVFFIADTHFGDGNILRYENRPFATVEEMDQELVRRWNQKVGEEDTVFHLGDVSAHSAEEDRQLLGQLHGKKVLVLGNHGYTFSSSSFFKSSENHSSLPASSRKKVDFPAP